MKQIAQKASSVELAIELALRELGVARNEVDVTIIDRGRKGFFGIGAREAEVMVTVKQTKTIKQQEKDDPVTQQTEEKQSLKVSNESSIHKEPSNLLDRQISCDSPVSSQHDVKAEIEKIESNDRAVEETKLYLMNLAREMGIHDLKINTEIKGKYLIFSLQSEKAALLIGKRGQNLNALQQLSQLVANKYATQFKVVRLDVEDYRQRREQSLEQLAHRMADQAVRTGRKVHLEPMPSYERKVIHHALSSRLDIETYSEGVDPHRYVVIEPIR